MKIFVCENQFTQTKCYIITDSIEKVIGEYKKKYGEHTVPCSINPIETHDLILPEPILIEDILENLKKSVIEIKGTLSAEGSELYEQDTAFVNGFQAAILEVKEMT